RSMQVIQPAEPLPLPVVDLSALPERAREDRARILAAAEANGSFDLDRGPLMRGLLLRLAEGDHAVFLALHHIASDGWSLGRLLREVTVLYPAFAAGLPSPLPELPVQYADFAVWQRRWLASEALGEQVAYWRRRLASAPAALDLPADRPRPPVRGIRGGGVPVALPEEVAAA